MLNSSSDSTIKNNFLFKFSVNGLNRGVSVIKITLAIVADAAAK